MIVVSMWIIISIVVILNVLVLYALICVPKSPEEKLADDLEQIEWIEKHCHHRVKNK